MTRGSSFRALAAPCVLVLSLSAPDAALAQPGPPPQPEAPAAVPSAATTSADFTQPIPYAPSLPRAAAVDEDDDVESAAPRRKRRKLLSESRPARLQWQPGEAIPPGYRVADGPDKRFVIGGITTFGAMYLSSIVGGLIGITVNAGDELSPLFVPLAGPFITIATSNADRAAAYVLALDGIGQIAGGAFFMVGFLKRDRWLQRDEIAPPQLSIGPRGASLRMEF